MTKKKFTEAERLELAKTLDKDLDEFIDNLAKNQASNNSKKPFNFDEWCKEIENHPFFMTELKKNEFGEYPEAIQALQALKYEEMTDETTAEELIENAECAKNEGNKNFKFYKYRWAIETYTNGINFRCPNNKLNSILYANRAAAHKKIGNIRSALKDCLIAQKLNPLHEKAILRACECFLELGYGQECIDWINFSVKNYSDIKKKLINQGEVEQLTENTLNIKQLNEFKAKANQLILKKKKDERKQKFKESIEIKKIKKLLYELKRRNINFKYPKLPKNDEDEEVLQDWYKKLEVNLPLYNDIPIIYYDNDTSELVWPVLLQYPEIGVTDLITDCAESTSFTNLFEKVFLEHSNFSIKNVRIFIALENSDNSNEILEVYLNQCLNDILTQKNVEIMQSLIVFQVYTCSHIEKYIEIVEGNKMKIKQNVL